MSAWVARLAALSRAARYGGAGRLRRLRFHWPEVAVGTLVHGGQPLDPRRDRDEPRAVAARGIRRGPSDGCRSRELAERAGLPMPTAHRLVGELVDWGALSRDATGRIRDRPPALGRRAARPGADRAATAGLAVPAGPLRRHARHRPPGGARRDGGALPGPAVRQRLRPGGQQHRFPAADARDRRRQGAARPRACGGAGGRAVRPAPRHAVHPHPAGHAAPAAGPRAPGRLRDDRRGDEPRRLLGGGADPGRAAAWWRRWASWCPTSGTTGRSYVAALQVAAQGIGRALAARVDRD